MKPPAGKTLCVLLLAGASGVALLSPGTLAQPDDGGPRDPDRRQSGRPADGPDRGEPAPRPLARAVLARRLEAVSQQKARLEEALRMLDAGATPEEIREKFPDLRDGREGRGGPGGEGRGPRDLGPGPADDAFRPEERGGPGGPDGRRPPPPRRERGQDRALTEAEKQVVRDFLGVSMPRMRTLLDELEKNDPATAERKFAEAMPRVRRLMELREHDPEMYTLRLEDIREGRQAMDAARWIARHDANGGAQTDAARAQHLDQLRARLGAQFDVRTRIAEHELKRMRGRLEAAEADVASRAAKRSEAVERFLSDMLDRERDRLERGDNEIEPPPPGLDGPPGGPPDGPPGRPRGDRPPPPPH